ncbi:MAG TPA: peptidoglycan bridge formation glycyltransferase FemA/FemB family protein [Candidatus Acidoferrales bacterium]|nr:peptidoglycan bridge formation glycyltransferase FemA/FemB family protein [Candidatus Acidoferrales bacterium]
MAPAGSQSAAEWDGRLREWPQANLLQSYAWGEVQNRAGWVTERLEVPTASGPLPVSAQVTASGLPGFSRIYVPRGPVCPASDLASFQAVLGALVDLGRQHRALALEVEAPWAEGEVPESHPWLSWAPTHARQPLATVAVNLRPAPEAIIASFHAKARYNVRLAERRGVVVNEEATVAELTACMEATEERQRIHLPSAAHLKVVMEQLGSSARILAAQVEGEVVAAILIASFAGEASYLYGGATGRHRDRMPNQLLHWRAMLRAREEGCHHYDLWGIPENEDPHHPWRGLAQFKLGFGGEQLRFAGARFLRLRPAGATILAVADAARRKVRTRGRR